MIYALSATVVLAVALVVLCEYNYAKRRRAERIAAFKRRRLLDNLHFKRD